MRENINLNKTYSVTNPENKTFCNTKEEEEFKSPTLENKISKKNIIQYLMQN